MHSKGLVLIQDGLADRPIKELGDLTPLEAASTPVLDGLAAAGLTGTMDLLGPGIAVGTHIGHLILFGQNLDSPTPRGPVEAAGIGLELAAGEVALRFNFATVNPDGGVLDRRADRIRIGTDELIDSLNQINTWEGVRVRFFPATQHRGVLTLEGEGLSPAISDSDPGGGVPDPRVVSVSPLKGTAEAARTAKLLNSLLQECGTRLSSHPLNQQRAAQGLLPANFILTRGAGSRGDSDGFVDQFGIRTVCVSGEATVWGAARLSQIDVVRTDRMTAGPNTDLDEKARIVLQCLENYELVFLHLKACDIAAHDRDPVGKMKFIEKTDRMLGRLLSQVRGDLTFSAVSDHATLCSTGAHSGDPVPVLLNGPGVQTDAVTKYGERFCARGKLGRLLGREFREVLVNHLRTPAA